MLSVRERTLIEMLIKRTQPITIAQLAQRLGVSKRTVLRDMPYVDQWFERHQVTLQRQAQKGLYLELDDATQQALLINLKESAIDQVYRPQERQTFIATELLQANDVFKLSYFAKTLDVSEATISHDLDHVVTWLNDYDLTLARKQGYGIWVEGAEKDKRRALMRFLYERLDGAQLRDVINQYVTTIHKQETPTLTHSRITQKLLDMIDLKTIHLIEEAIKASEYSMGFQFVESSYTALAVHLALAIKRLQKGELIDMAEDTLTNLKLFDEFAIATNLTEHLAKQLNLDIPQAEVGYITMHLKGARYHHGLYDESVLKFNELVISNYQLASIINEMIRLAEKDSGYPLRQSEALLVGLVDHIRLSINRIHMNLDIRNPLLDKIKEHYPEVFDLAKRCASILEEKLTIRLPESEIGFIALHLGSAIEAQKNTTPHTRRRYRIVVTCMSGFGTSKMLAERIKSEFTNLDVVGIFSSTKISEVWLLENHVDLIISTVPFDNRLLPVVTVNPLLIDNDLEKIDQALKATALIQKQPLKENKPAVSIDTIETLQAYTKHVLELLHHLIIDDDVSLDDHDFLSAIATRFELKDTIEKDLRARERIGTIFFEQEQVLFLHARSEGVRVLTVQILRLAKTHTYKHHRVQTILVMLAPKDLSNPALDVISELSRLCVSDESFLSALKDREASQLKQWFEQHFTSYLKEKNTSLLT